MKMENLLCTFLFHFKHTIREAKKYSIYPKKKKRSSLRPTIFGQACSFNLSMVYEYEIVNVNSVDCKNEMILLGSEVQEDKYQISVVTLPAVLQTEIKDNPC